MYKIVERLVQSKIFGNFIIALIILNGISMGFETSKDIAATYHTFFSIFDTLVITIFTIEIILRIFIHRISFFKDGWSIFDFFIVSISLLPTSGGLEILRILRVLRLLRLITVIPQMRKVIMALVSVIPGMISIAGILTLLFYISAIMATQLYGETFPQWFGTLGESFYTLFQIMTLESWSMGIVRPILEIHPFAWTFFIPFIFIVTFIMVNLIIAIVVDAMTELTSEEKNLVVSEIHDSEDHTKIKLQELRNDIKELKDLMLSNKL
ncbi:MAG: ion transporter [Sulfurimonas sp.]|nr:ion transporter [Sulfurimonas sp.]